MTTADRVLLYVGGTICILAILFAAAAIFVDDFRANGTIIVGTILGALTTMASIIVGVSAARGLGGGEDPTTSQDDQPPKPPMNTIWDDDGGSDTGGSP